MRLSLSSSLLVLTVLNLLSSNLIPSGALAADRAPAPPSTNTAAVASATSPENFSGHRASAEARQVAEWVLASGDNDALPFMIVDKVNATMFIFAQDGVLLGASPVLLGLARGDDSPPGIGERPLARIRPSERITPAGRFVAQLGLNLAGQDILWVDYAAAVSVHRANDPITGLTANGRLARLTSPTVSDNRVSHGCINVATAFFESVLRPAFAGTSGIVYVLPETRSIRAQFAGAT